MYSFLGLSTFLLGCVFGSLICVIIVYVGNKEKKN